MINKRWYDSDPILKEALELLIKEESAKLYFPEIPLEHSLKIMDEIADINIKNLKKNGGNIYDNVELILKELNTKFKLYIVSNTAETEYIEAFFESSGTKKYFDDIFIIKT